MCIYNNNVCVCEKRCVCVLFTKRRMMYFFTKRIEDPMILKHCIVTFKNAFLHFTNLLIPQLLITQSIFIYLHY
jgi:hypothetical protein